MLQKPRRQKIRNRSLSPKLPMWPPLPPTRRRTKLLLPRPRLLPMPLRDPRPVHDQIIDHDLVTLSDGQVLRLLLIEMRRIRADMAQMRISRNDPEGPQP